ncbi:zinc ABC transporter substrate-binding protein [Halosquirtibacter xylanolyticus]|uniref:metal ABC transporter solute-binding protein, Zn/Mn family n=1 Tax=Halosquirtibacter xylanolyticus TaxID=3374599 RepID=UPI0037479A26|nr:zinc ABC transporter substrate-binding protein [Prolixibacteraceae bacterium]
MKTIYIFAIIATLSLITSCKPNKRVQDTNQGNTKQILYVSIQPLKYFVDQIVKDRFDVKVLVPPGSSPETFAPSSKQIAELENAMGFFKVGPLTYENRWGSEWQAAHPGTELINCSIGVPKQTLAHQHGDHVHYGTDPHIWLAPKTAKIIATNIYEGILQFDPANKSFYRKNFKNLLSTIEGVKSDLDKMFEGHPHQAFLIFHPVLGYLSSEYHLHQEAIEFEGKKPSLKQLTHFVELAKKENIQSILVQKEFSSSSAKIIAKEINGKVVVINPLGYNWPEVMREIGEAISLSNK